MVPVIRSLTVLLLFLTACSEEETGRELFARAEQSFATGQFIQAEQAYEQFLQARPDDPLRWEAWNRLLLIADKVRKNPEHSVDILQSMFLEFEEDPAKATEVLDHMATVYQSGLDQPGKALDVWERSLEYCPAVPGACFNTHWGLATVSMDMGRIQEAREHFEICLELKSSPQKQAMVLYALAKLHLFNGEQGAALERLETLQTLTGDIGQHRSLAIFMAADIHVQEGRIDSARALLESIRNTHPNPMLVDLRINQLPEAEQTANATR